MTDRLTELRVAEIAARERIAEHLEGDPVGRPFHDLDAYRTAVEQRARAETAERLYALYIDKKLAASVLTTLAEMQAGVEPTPRSELKRTPPPDFTSSPSSVSPGDLDGQPPA